MSSIPVPAPEAPAAPSSSNLVPVLVAFAIGTAVSIALGVYGRLHTPTGHAVNIAGFATGASQLKLIESQLKFNSSPFDFAALDAALEKLAVASGPIKQRTLLAGAHTISANGSISVPEFELLRAIAAALDVPLPPLGS